MVTADIRVALLSTLPAMPPNCAAETNSLKISNAISRFSYTINSDQVDRRLSYPLTGQGAGGGTRTSERMVTADIRVALLSTLPAMPPNCAAETNSLEISNAISRFSYTNNDICISVD
ncbi:hypothetical protein PoB_003699600 [Plakobranchus ocellatus]|uniref:Uncharacterized protein n=1 Tax=Plakobranchus ocellatus TaxID=259542 RepID=A0AAV4AQQ8_9GAST|nr:hypothetical protein PoB_003699600 [Plakobranchus ocellatus]